MKAKIMNISSFRRRQDTYGYILVGVSFLVLTLLTVRIFAPQVDTDATSQQAEQTVGPYTMSMANDSAATINITPTSSQAVYTASNNLSVINTCDAGATITMTTNSTTSNSLTRAAVNSDTLAKDIVATTSTSLDNNSWGYALNNSSTYYAVPKKGTTAATIYNASAAQTTALSVPVLFGVKTDNSMPSGAYTNDVVYTMTPKAGCLTYSVTWDFDGGTAKSGATYKTSMAWGETTNLSTLTPTRSGYTFAGWTNGSSNFTGNETAANLNSTNAKAVTIKAKWVANCASGVASETINLNVNASKTLSYTGAAKCLLFAKDGNYKIELWGAQGSNSTYGIGGYGGYVSGTTTISGNALYVFLGQKPANKSYTGGWNGGGNGASGNLGQYGYGSGGATDIRVVYGAWNDATSLRSRILVAGAGGGSGQYGDNYNTTVLYNGGHAGGINGYIGNADAGSNNGWWPDFAGTGGTQVSAGDLHPADTIYAGTQYTTQNQYCINQNYNKGGFGYGGSDVECAKSYYGGSAGGSGWYGGGASMRGHNQGGGGSSYISGHTGSVAVTSTSSSSPKSGCTTGTTSNACSISPYGYTFTNTVMIDGLGYKWTNTKGSLQAMPNPSGGNYASGVGHSGNGYARITYLGT